MRAVTHIQATYKLSSNDAMGVRVDIANMIFEQAWEKEPDFTENSSDKEINSDIESEIEAHTEKEQICKKKRRVQKDLRRRFPH